MHTVLCGIGIQVLLCILFCECELSKFGERNYFLPSFIAACAAARRAIGTLKGEQET